MMTNLDKIRIGVIGVGSMGRNHARVLSQNEDCDFIGIYDVDEARAAQICEAYGCQGFGDLDSILNSIDAVVIAAPTFLHGDLGMECLNRGIHTLMEKPLAASVVEAEGLVKLAETKKVILMAGHIERYNPAISLMINTIKKNKEPVVSFEARRLNPFDGTRCLDVDVLYDLLIHDVDLALEIADSEISDISSFGKEVYSNLVDDAHTLLRFKNGVTAVFWTSKCSPRKIREIAVTTRTRFYQADSITRTLTIHTSRDVNPLADGVCQMGDIEVEEILQAQKEPLRAEIEDFLRSIKTNSSPTANGRRALNSLIVLEQISKNLISH
jgi:predicted dehydrogenase